MHNGRSSRRSFAKRVKAENVRSLLPKTIQRRKRQNSIADSDSSRSEAFKHTARGLEAIGFNAQASMYHVDREYSPESDVERADKKKNKQKKSFLKKLVGGGKEKGEKI